MKVVWQDEARAQVALILQDIGEFSIAAANRWLDDLDQTVDRLATFPDSGHVNPEFDEAKLRETIEGSYKLAYLRHEDRIEVISVWHGSRRPPGRGMRGDIEDE